MQTAQCSCMQGPNINGQSCTSRPDHQVNTDSRGRILGRNPDKSLKSFPPCFSQSPLQLCLEISICSNSHNLLHISSNSRNPLKGQCHEIFCFRFFSWIAFPQAPDNNIRIISNLPPVSLTPVANNGNNIRLQTHESELEGKNVYLCFLYYPKVTKQNY